MSRDMFNNDLTKTDSFGTPRATTQPPAELRPTPWTTQPYGSNVLAVDANGFPAAMFYKEDEAAAALRVINNHQQLVECLRRCKLLFLQTNNPDDYIQDMIVEIDAVLHDATT